MEKENNLNISNQKEYYKKLREECLLIKNNQFSFGQGLVKHIYPFMRNYKIEMQGEENIPKDTNVIFLANHSNSHDSFTAYEIFSLLNRHGSEMVASDCLNPVTTSIFNICNATLLDRGNKEERKSSVLRMSKKILEGNDALIYGEGTWNLHPYRLMHNVRQGVAQISAITNAPIIPTIIEYIEENDLVDKENKLYKKCIIRFGKPVVINYNESLINQTNMIKEQAEKLRSEIWKDYNIYREKLEDIDPMLYLNHTYVKKFKALGFTYDSHHEEQYLLFLNGENKENEYCLSPDGKLVPGIIEKDFELRKIMK